MALLAVSQPIFQRAMRPIATISNAFPAVVTTTINHQYITGMIVRLNIPLGYGMQQANQLYNEITVTGDTAFTINIDTTNMDPFLSLIAVGTTDNTGALSGTLSAQVVPFSIGQAFYVGNETLLVIVDSGAMFSNSTASGTFNISTGAYSIAAALPSTPVYFTLVTYPLNYQFAQCTPIGEINSTLAAATQNVLGTGFYNS